MLKDFWLTLITHYYLVQVFKINIEAKKDVKTNKCAPESDFSVSSNYKTTKIFSIIKCHFKQTNTFIYTLL